jgi:peptidoglycan/xylan/chitin deacetylase (PgdA/CDA1 family)
MPIWLHRFFKQYTWKIPTTDSVIYLSFDDGPDPEVTPYVLQILETYQAKATFFCVGENLRRYPEVAADVRAKGHQIGNHTQHHLKGWTTSSEIYHQNITACQAYIGSIPEAPLFRPPYGRLSPKQGRWILQQGYQCIMWDILSFDYDRSLDTNWAINRIVKLSRKGSIIVFHDSQKAKKQLEKLLPEYLSRMTQLGYRFELIPTTTTPIKGIQ